MPPSSLPISHTPSEGSYPTQVLSPAYDRTLPRLLQYKLLAKENSIDLLHQLSASIYARLECTERILTTQTTMHDWSEKFHDSGFIQT